MVASIWALAGIVLVLSAVGRLISQIRRLWSRIRRARLVPGWSGSLLHELAQYRLVVWPFLIVGGPISAMAVFGFLSAELWAELVVGSFWAGMLLQSGRGVVRFLRQLNGYAALGWLVVMVALWIGAAATVSNLFDWPAPGNDGYFATAAQINATLLVVGVINAVPTAWQISSRDQLAWILTAPTVAAIGLGASIAGSVSAKDTEALFVLSVAPVGPIILALMMRAYNEVQRRDQQPPKGRQEGDRC